MSQPDPVAAGRQGLQQIEKALGAKPKKDGEALTEATKDLCIFRDDLIAASRDGRAETRGDLETINAVLSIVAATHYPLGPIPWEELDKARGWLADLLARKEQAAAPPQRPSTP